MLRKKWILILVLILIAFPVILLILNFIPIKNNISNSIENNNTNNGLENNPNTSLESITEINPLYTLDYKAIIEGMFPNRDYKFLKQNYIRVFAEDDSYYEDFSIEKIVYDYFVDDKDELLVVLRKLNTPHAEGLYKVHLAVFDSETLKIKSPVKEIFADEVELGFFKSRDRTYVMFVGNVTYTGWTEYSGELYEVSKDNWKNLFPENADFWEHKMAVIGRDRLVMYERKILESEEEHVIPDYEFVYKNDLIWEQETKTFIEKSILPED